MAETRAAQPHGLRRAADSIRDALPGARIILFGSTARHADDEESDVDLCVVVENPTARTVELARRIRRRIHPILRRSLDVLVYDSEVFRERVRQPTSFEAEIEEEGVEL